MPSSAAGSRPSSRRAAITAPAWRRSCSAPRLRPDFAGTIVDLGAGAGVAGMVAAARCRGRPGRPCRSRRRGRRLRPCRPGAAGQPGLRAARVHRRGRYRGGGGRARGGRPRPRHGRCGHHQSALPCAGDHHRTARQGAGGGACLERRRPRPLVPRRRLGAEARRPARRHLPRRRHCRAAGGAWPPLWRARHPAGPAARRRTRPSHSRACGQGQPRGDAPVAAACPSRRHRRHLSVCRGRHPARLAPGSPRPIRFGPART